MIESLTQTIVEYGNSITALLGSIVAAILLNWGWALVGFSKKLIAKKATDTYNGFLENTFIFGNYNKDLKEVFDPKFTKRPFSKIAKEIRKRM